MGEMVFRQVKHTVRWEAKTDRVMEEQGGERAVQDFFQNQVVLPNTVGGKKGGNQPKYG